MIGICNNFSFSCSCSCFSSFSMLSIHMTLAWLFLYTLVGLVGSLSLVYLTGLQWHQVVVFNVRLVKAWHQINLTWIIPNDGYYDGGPRCLQCQNDTWSNEYSYPLHQNSHHQESTSLAVSRHLLLQHKNIKCTCYNFLYTWLCYQNKISFMSTFVKWKTYRKFITPKDRYDWLQLS